MLENDQIIKEQRKRREFLYHIYRSVKHYNSQPHPGPVNFTYDTIGIYQKMNRNWGLAGNAAIAPLLYYHLAQGNISLTTVWAKPPNNGLAAFDWRSPMSVFPKGLYITHKGETAVENDLELLQCLVKNGSAVDWSKVDEIVESVERLAKTVKEINSESKTPNYEDNPKSQTAMHKKILDAKLEVTPENLRSIVSNFFFARRAVNVFAKEEEKSLNYEAELCVKSYNVDVRAVNGPIVGNIVILPLTNTTTRVKIIFNNWEDGPQAHLTWGFFNGHQIDDNKKPMFYDLAYYILATVDGNGRADLWLSRQQQLENTNVIDQINHKKVPNPSISTDEQVKLQLKPPGRRPDPENEIAFRIILESSNKQDGQERAYQYWCDEKGIVEPQKRDRDAFKKAMKRAKERHNR